MSKTVSIDPALLAEAVEIAGLGSNEATVEEALRLMIRRNERREALRNLWGIGWEGDLEAMRTDLPPPADPR